MAHQVRERVAPHLRSYAHPTGKPTAIRIIIIIPIRPIIIQYRHPSKPTSVIIVHSYDLYFFQCPYKPTASDMTMTIQYQHPKKPTAYSYKKLVHTISSFSTPINKPTAVAAILIKNKITGDKGVKPKMCLFAVGVGVYGRYQAS